MSDPKSDLFGKIDALLGRRIPDALLDKGLDIEDFPLLTEVVDQGSEDATGHLPERRRVERRELDRRLGDRRQDGRRATDRQAEAPPPLPPDMGEMARLVAAMEQRLVDMFIRQQLRMEEAVRKAVRDEMARLGGDGR